MIITCPACRTRYLVDDGTLGADATRRVRCASCGNLWNYSSEGARIRAAAAETAATDEAAPAAAPGGTVPRPNAPPLLADPDALSSGHPTWPTNRGRPSVVAEWPAVGRRRSVTLDVVVGMIMLAVAFVIVAILARERIMAMWPSARPAYARFHLAESPDQRREFGSMPRRTAGWLIVAGNIVNRTGRTDGA